ncbi:MAG TPA: hypothetical protein VKJ65_03425, partial [Phycisphaerae bacterium]|nr:hypothetical protein [Phycisphaerae bacterium]
MRKFASLSWLKLVHPANWTKLGLVCVIGAFINAAQALPVNDNFANASGISGTTGTTNGSNVNATLEFGEPTSIIIDYPFATVVSNSVWYAWTAPANGNVTFDTLGSSFDTVLAAWTGNSVSALSLVAANDDIDPDVVVQSSMTFYAVAGTTYFIAVYGYAGPPAAQGSIQLNWTMQTSDFSAGQFRFTSSDYVDSQNESQYAQGSGMHPQKNTGDPLGARVTVTRVGGAVGRVEVGYTVTNGTLPSFSLTFGQNVYITNFDSGGNVLSYTNIYW